MFAFAILIWVGRGENPIDSSLLKRVWRIIDAVSCWAILLYCLLRCLKIAVYFCVGSSKFFTNSSNNLTTTYLVVILLFYRFTQHFISQVYLDVFSVVVLVLGGALACYGKHLILVMCLTCHNYIWDVNSAFLMLMYSPVLNVDYLSFIFLCYLLSE
jgi:hypothetical protein